MHDGMDRLIARILSDDVESPAHGPERLEDISELERFGLGKPAHRLERDEEVLTIPVIARFLYEHRADGGTEAYLAAFGLNAGIYDRDTNPNGLFIKEVTTVVREAMLLNVALRLAGIRTRDIEGFFGVSPTYIQNYAALPYKETVARVDSLRNTFPFDNPEQFPGVHAKLAEIKLMIGLDKEDLFVPGKIPQVSPSRDSRGRGASGDYQKVLLEEGLALILDELRPQHVLNARRRKTFLRGTYIAPKLRAILDSRSE